MSSLPIANLRYTEEKYLKPAQFILKLFNYKYLGSKPFLNRQSLVNLQ